MGQSIKTKQERLIRSIRNFGIPFGESWFINGTLNSKAKKKLDSIVKQCVALHEQEQDQ